MLVSHAQGEANIWYFGQNAGLDFNSGIPVALTNGQLVTEEGCATISNSSGQLLFYTDGITVYNRNHSIMLNGTGLMGHPSSTQSATIVPKPESSNLFYIFTTDNENDPNGFRYSIVDMDLDSGNGAVTSDKNVLVYTPTIENLGVTKHGNGQDYWIITHGWDSNSFIVYQLTSAGLNLTPVISNIGHVITGLPTDYTAAGTIKISPSGSKLAFTSVSDIAQLFDFDNSTGILSNVITLLTEPGDLYGVAFSPDESLLYISNTFGKIHQFNLNAVDIPGSKVTIHNGNIPGQMQVGPDNKIYIAFNNRTFLGVINNPNLIGLNCDFVLNGCDLAGKRSKLGLPSFNQSIFFTPTIVLSSNCVGEISNFNFTTNQTILSVLWDFGDGTTSSNISPNHIYTNQGIFNVSVTVVTPYGSGTSSTQISIYPKPIVTNDIIFLKQCDDDNDGFSAFNLNEALPLIGAAETYNYSFHETELEAQQNSNPIANTAQYTNQTVSTDQLFIRVENANGCYRVVTLNLIVSTTLIPASFHRTFTVCDDEASGSNADGISTFDFSSAATDIQALFPSGQLLDITFYNTISDALAEQNAITDIANHTNSGFPNIQSIYIRVDSQLDNECLGLGHHITLQVERIPIIQPLILTQCDDDQDGFFAFDTTTLENNLLNGLTNVTVSYFDGNGNPVNITNPFVSNSQTLTVEVKNTYGNQCSYQSTLQFVVDELPVANSLPVELTTVCDDEVIPSQQDGTFPFDTSNFQTTILGTQTNRIVKYYDQNGNVLSSPLPNPFVSGTQNLYVEVVNSVNNTCATSTVIPLVVNPIPIIDLYGDELICSDNPTFTKNLNAGLLDENMVPNFTYQWYFNGTILENETAYELTVNTSGIYSVDVTNSNGCFITRTIQVTASDIAVIQNVAIVDLSSENTVTILASGQGDYEYSLDGESYQTSNHFTSVESGVYTVYVKDLNGCGVTTKEISVLGIPKFFTPNGDGYNDFWAIKGINTRLNAETIIHIYDRYGKLIKQINPLSQGWDGTFNGVEMPSSDYWYSIQLDDDRIIKGHFSLIR